MIWLRGKNKQFFCTLVTSGAMKTWSAVTQSRHRMAELVRLGALADLVTVLPKCTWKTSWRREGEGSHVMHQKRIVQSLLIHARMNWQKPTALHNFASRLKSSGGRCSCGPHSVRSRFPRIQEDNRTPQRRGGRTCPADSCSAPCSPSHTCPANTLKRKQPDKFIAITRKKCNSAHSHYPLSDPKCRISL